MAAPQGRLRFFWGAAHSYRRYLLSPLVALKSNLVRFCLRFLETVVVSRKTQVFLAIGNWAVNQSVKILVFCYELFFEQSM